MLVSRPSGLALRMFVVQCAHDKLDAGSGPEAGEGPP